MTMKTLSNDISGVTIVERSQPPQLNVPHKGSTTNEDLDFILTRGGGALLLLTVVCFLLVITFEDKRRT